MADDWVVAKEPLRPVMMMKLTNMTLAEVKNRKRRPSLSTLVAAAIAHSRFQTFRQAEIKVWFVTDVTPIEFRMTRQMLAKSD